MPARSFCGSFSDESKAAASFLARFVNTCSSRTALRVLHLNMVSAMSPKKGTRPIAPSKRRFPIIMLLIFFISLASLPPDIRIAELISQSARRKSRPSPTLEDLVSIRFEKQRVITSGLPTLV